MANVLKEKMQREVVRHLVDGCGIRTTERITGVHRDTICRLLVRIGTGCRSFLDETMQGLTLRHLQCDEIWTFVGKKQAQLGAEEKRFTNRTGDIYLWVALDEQTKLIPTFRERKTGQDWGDKFYAATCIYRLPFLFLWSVSKRPLCDAIAR